MAEKISKYEIRELKVIRKILERHDYTISSGTLGKIIAKLERD